MEKHIVPKYQLFRKDILKKEKRKKPVHNLDIWMDKLQFLVLMKYQMECNQLYNWVYDFIILKKEKI